MPEIARRAAIAGEAQHGTPIEWTWFPGYVGDTWNPTRGCSMAHGSAGPDGGCWHCYAMTLAARYSLSAEQMAAKGKPAKAQAFHGFAIMTDKGPHWTGRVELIEEKLTEPLRRRKPTCWFVNSMSDLFHEKLPDEAIDRVFAVMALCPNHLFIILTKRAERMREYATSNMDSMDIYRIAMGYHILGRCNGIFGEAHKIPLPNVILGVSVENQATADARIPHLLRTPAACRMISLEPQLADVDLESIRLHLAGESSMTFSALHSTDGLNKGTARSKLDWVVQGGESGPGARPFDLVWARRTRDQCKAAGTSYFLKQLGARPIERNLKAALKNDVTVNIAAKKEPWVQGFTRITAGNDTWLQRFLRLRDCKGGDEAEWPTDLRDCRQFPEVTHAV